MKIIKTKIENVKTEIEQAVKFGSFQSSNLILLVADHGEVNQITTQLFNGQFKNTSRLLSEKLVVMSQKDRKRQIHDLVSDLVKEAESICYLSRINVLFEDSLQTDPLKLLQHAAKKKPIIVILPGNIDNVSLNYAKPGLSDHKSYKLNEFQDVQVITTCGKGVSK
jgi:hypothetical protein